MREQWQSGLGGHKGPAQWSSAASSFPQIRTRLAPVSLSHPPGSRAGPALCGRQEETQPHPGGSGRPGAARRPPS